MDYQQLKDLKPRLYAEAGQAWKDWASQLDQHTNQVRRQIIDLVFAGDVWEDKSSDVARDYMEGLMRGMGQSFDDLEAVGGVLETFARDGADAQHKLSKNEQRALDGDLEIDSTGHVTVPEDRKDDPKADQLARDCNTGIKQAISDGIDAERDCARKLSYYDKRIPTLHQLNAQSDRLERQAEAAAKQAKRLLEQGVDNLSRQELQRLAELVQHTGDPAFATEFAEEVGPKGMMRLSLLAARASEAGYPELARQLQGDVAQMTATATDRTNGQHVSYQPHTPQEKADNTSWMDKLKEAGREEIGTDRNDPAGKAPEDSRPITGYHALAALMDDTKFSTEFLTEVGKDMYRYDVTENPESWQHDPVAGRLDLDLSDSNEHGLDPMSGLMEGLRNNPEAAQQFFSQGFEGLKGEAEAYKPLNYLLTERDWGGAGHGPGTNNLGEALEAATTTTRNPAAAQIMGEMVHQLGSDPNATLPPNMRDSMGQMIGYYIDDVHSAIRASSWGSNDSDFILSGGLDRPALPGYEGAHVGFKESELVRVMSEAAKDPDAYQHMWEREMSYAALKLDYEASPERIEARANNDEIEDPLGAFKGAAKAAGEVFGTLTAANADAAEQIAASQNAVIGAGGEGAKVGIAAIGAAAGSVGGPAGAAAGAAGAAAGSWAINEVVKSAQEGNMSATDREIAQMYGNKEFNVKQLVQNAMWQNGLEAPNVPENLRYPSGEPIPYSEMTPEQRSYFDDVWMEKHGGGISNIMLESGDSMGTGEQNQDQATNPTGEET